MKPNVVDIDKQHRKKLQKGAVINQKPVQRVLIQNSLADIITLNNYFSADECKKIMKLVPDKWVAALVAKHGSDNVEERVNLRNNSAHMLDAEEETYWVFQKLLTLVEAANKKYFHVDIDHFDAVQLSRYQTGEYYRTHMDLGPGQLGNRKISLTLQLTDPSEYEGGDLVMDSEDHTASRELGSVTMFPSFLTHHVTQVTKGTRYSLVAWISGEHRFK